MVADQPVIVPRAQLTVSGWQAAADENTWAGLLVVGYGGEFGVGEEHFPTLIAPEHFQTHQRLVAPGAPELATALQAALELTAGRFDGSRTDGLMAFTPVLIFHPFLVVLVVFDGLVSSRGGGFGQTRLECF
jgi:hypothetical protein